MDIWLLRTCFCVARRMGDGVGAGDGAGWVWGVGRLDTLSFVWSNPSARLPRIHHLPCYSVLHSARCLVSCPSGYLKFHRLHATSLYERVPGKAGARGLRAHIDWMGADWTGFGLQRERCGCGAGRQALVLYVLYLGSAGERRGWGICRIVFTISLAPTGVCVGVHACVSGFSPRTRRLLGKEDGGLGCNGGSRGRAYRFLHCFSLALSLLAACAAALLPC